jgi:hypothetical protein
VSDEDGVVVLVVESPVFGEIAQRDENFAVPPADLKFTCARNVRLSLNPIGIGS